MSRDEFVKYIESIGFKRSDSFYNEYIYNDFKILCWTDKYQFSKGSPNVKYYLYSNLAPELLKLERSYKLKELLK